MTYKLVKMPKNIFLCLFFACFGISCAIAFVALGNLINQRPFCNEALWSLTGKNHLWMLPIYTLIPFFAGPLIAKLASYPLHFRLTVYTCSSSSRIYNCVCTRTTTWQMPLGVHYRLAFYGLYSFRLFPILVLIFLYN